MSGVARQHVETFALTPPQRPTANSFSGPASGFAPLAHARARARVGVTVTRLDELYAEMRPTTWILKPAIQRGMFYAFVAHPNHGKTALALLFAFMAVLERGMGSLRVKGSWRVRYLAGENVDDVVHRVAALCSFFKVNPKDIAGHIKVISQPFKFDSQEHIDSVARQVAGSRPDFMIVDTGPAYFTGESENDNTEQQLFGGHIRKLMLALGGPATLMLTHPAKGAGKDALDPRGGSAMLGTLDGVLRCCIDNEVIELSHGKRRGPGFEPMHFKLHPFEVPGMTDNFGEPTTTVYAAPVSDDDADKSRVQAWTDENKILYEMQRNPGGTMSDWAAGAGFGARNMGRLGRIMERLENLKFTKKEGRSWVLTPIGVKEASKDKP
jgi:AAA domain